MALTRPTARYRRLLTILVVSFLLTTLFVGYARLTGSDNLIPADIRPYIPLGNKNLKPADKPMAEHFADAARPALVGFPTILEKLDEKHIPAAGNGRRLVIVGDVHGMIEPLQALLKKIEFRGDVDGKAAAMDKSDADHLVFVGDMINKGPSSAEVVDLAMRLGASSVRGNHEDRILLEREAMGVSRAAGDVDAAEKTFEDLDNPDQQVLSTNLQRGDPADRAVASSLSDDQAAWLAKLPAILDLGPVQGFPDTGRVVVAHAGLVPLPRPLESQDPWAVMNIRTLLYPREDLRREEARNALIDVAVPNFRQSAEYLSDPDAWNTKRIRKKLREEIPAEDVDAEFLRRTRPSDRALAVPSDGREGAPWSSAWEDAQRALRASARVAVVYGHDSRTGLNVAPYTIGLDSGCVKGGELSALVIEATADGVRHEVVSVKCTKPKNKQSDLYGKGEGEDER